MNATRLQTAADPTDDLLQSAVPLNACVIFDTGASARSAKAMIRRVTQGDTNETMLLRLCEHLLPSEGLDSVREAAKTDLLVVAMQTACDLPSFGKAWLNQWAKFRGSQQEGVLVAVVTDETALVNSTSPLIAYLKTIARVSGLAFFHGRAFEFKEASLLGLTTRPLSPGAPLALLRRRSAAQVLRPLPRWGINE